VALTIGVDIGGTKMLGGIVDSSGNVLVQTRRATPADNPPETLSRILDVIQELLAAHQVEAIGIGAAGWIDADRSTVLFAPNLAWRNEPLRDAIQERVDVPVFVDNDADAGAWAEFEFGAARDARNSMVLFTIGTGIGGGIILGGKIVRGAHGMAAEMGHVQMVPDGHPCGCGRTGCAEQYASGTALVRFATAAAAEQPEAARGLLDVTDGDLSRLTGQLVTQAARDSDGAALAAFDQVGYWLGIALADMVQILDPEVFVIGGGVVEAGDLLLKPTRHSYAEALRHRGKLPVADIRPAKMGNLAGVVGAADLARRR
jgi:glucokinase